MKPILPSSATLPRRGRPRKHFLDLAGYHCPFCGATDGLIVRAAYGKVERRYLLKCAGGCGKTFSQHRGTPLFHAKKPAAEIARIAQALCDGNGIRGAARVCRVNQKTVARCLVKSGAHASKIASKRMRALPLREVQTDELETHVLKREKNVSRVDRAFKPDAGRAWVIASVDAETKLMPLIGVARTVGTHTLSRFGKALAARVEPWPLFATDKRNAYEKAITEATGGKALHVQTAGHASNDRPKATRIVTGSPEAVAEHYAESTASTKINTAFAETFFKTLRTANRRLQRKVNGISKKRTALQCQLALFAAYYNFVKAHRTLREELPNPNGKRWAQRTPAMAAGLTARPWTMEELLAAWA